MTGTLPAYPCALCGHSMNNHRFVGSNHVTCPDCRDGICPNLQGGTP